MNDCQCDGLLRPGYLHQIHVTLVSIDTFSITRSCI